MYASQNTKKGCLLALDRN